MIGGTVLGFRTFWSTNIELTTIVLGILYFLASLKISRLDGGGWLKNPILMGFRYFAILLLWYFV